MADHDLTSAQLRERLWKELDKAHVVMLGLVGGEPHHMQPMAPFGDRDGDAIWFFTQRDSDLVRDAGAGHDAMACVMAKDMEFQACIHGVLAPDHDREKIERFWSASVSAWFPKGKDDPNLILMRLDPVDAQLWLSNRGPIAYPLEIAKANLTHKQPDLGQRGHLRM
jgi:general stress protein 26